MTVRIEVAGRCLELIVRVRPASSQVQIVQLAGHGGLKWAPAAGMTEEQVARIAGEEVARVIRAAVSDMTTRQKDGQTVANAPGVAV